MTALSIPSRFAAQAALTPDAAAVSEAASGAALTYRELEQRANRLAHHLDAKRGSAAWEKQASAVTR